MVQAIKKLQALHNDDVNKIGKETGQEKSAKENFYFLIDFATIAMVSEDTKLTKDEPQTSTKPGIIVISSHKENGKRLFERSGAI